MKYKVQIRKYRRQSKGLTEAKTRPRIYRGQRTEFTILMA